MVELIWVERQKLSLSWPWVSTQAKFEFEFNSNSSLNSSSTQFYLKNFTEIDKNFKNLEFLHIFWCILTTILVENTEITNFSWNFGQLLTKFISTLNSSQLMSWPNSMSWVELKLKLEFELKNGQLSSNTDQARTHLNFWIWRLAQARAQGHFFNWCLARAQHQVLCCALNKAPP